MRFALLGNHSDGLAVARALCRTGRHEIAAVTSPPDDQTRTWIGSPRLVHDLADVIADPALEAVIVAGPVAAREVQLRRALQSERHVLCVHPADLTPDLAYEAALIQQDANVVLLPLLPGGLHPAVRRLTELLRPPDGGQGLGPIKLVELQLSAREPLLGDPSGKRVTLPGWDVLRRLGGEVAEVTAFAERPELSPGQPLFVSGSFQQGGQFQLTLRPHQPEAHGRLTVTAENGRAELTWPGDWCGPARLTWQVGDARGEQQWEAPDPWAAVAEAFEQCLARSPKTRTAGAALLSWQDEVRSLELDDAVCRSAERRRSVPLEYPVATEEAGFKGTMTLLGCGLLWLIVVLLVASVWLPVVGWGVLPALLLFLLLQTLLWVARRTSGGRSASSIPPADGR